MPRGGFVAMKISRTRGLLFVCIGLVFLVALEAGWRIRLGVPLLNVSDFRGEPVTILQTGGAVYDESLGWAQVPNFVGVPPYVGFNTLDFGIRKNSDRAEALDIGGVVAVGDSYTVGSQVYDQETWAAQLESMLNVRVLNAGVGGYGVDQIVLNAERLLPNLKPRVVIVGVHEEAILRTNYKSYNVPKPYFIKENRQWVLKNQPVPQRGPAVPEPFYRTVLSRFISAHYLFQRYFPDWWLTAHGLQFERAAAISGQSSCYALQRLHDKLSQDGILGLIVVQYTGFMYWRERPRAAYTQEVIDCAKRIGYDIADEFDAMSAIAHESIALLKQHYVMTANNTTFGHLSPKGNTLIAAMISDRLRGFDLSGIARAPEPTQARTRIQ